MQIILAPFPRVPFRTLRGHCYKLKVCHFQTFFPSYQRELFSTKLSIIMLTTACRSIARRCPNLNWLHSLCPVFSFGNGSGLCLVCWLLPLGDVLLVFNLFVHSLGCFIFWQPLNLTMYYRHCLYLTILVNCFFLVISKGNWVLYFTDLR